MADFANITLSAAFDMNIVEFFNYLVYLKEKDKHDELMFKNASRTK